jgi:hypothetical protein
MRVSSPSGHLKQAPLMLRLRLPFRTSRDSNPRVNRRSKKTGQQYLLCDSLVLLLSRTQLLVICLGVLPVSHTWSWVWIIQLDSNPATW